MELGLSVVASDSVHFEYRMANIDDSLAYGFPAPHTGSWQASWKRMVQIIGCRATSV